MMLGSSGENHETEMTRSSWIILLSSSAITDEILGSLLPGASVEMLERIAENPATPASILQILSASDDSRVRAAVAENPSTSDSILLAFCCDKSPDVRFRLAECPYISKRLLNLLAEDENCYVAFRARQTLERLQRQSGQSPVAIFERRRSLHRAF
jgi:hypothetical protein